MSFNRQPNLPNRRGPLVITAVILGVILIALVSVSGFYADWLWFRSVSFTNVWKISLTTKASLFAISGLLTSLIITANVVIAFRRRPMYVPMTVEADNLERYRAQIEPIRKVVTAGLAVVLFYFSGSAGSQLWTSWLLFRNSTQFGCRGQQGKSGQRRDGSDVFFRTPAGTADSRNGQEEAVRTGFWRSGFIPREFG